MQSPPGFPHKDLTKEINLLIRSRYGIICLDSTDSDQIQTLITHVADSMNLPLFIWSLTEGLRRSGNDKPVYGTEDINLALDHIRLADQAGIYFLKDIQPALHEHLTVLKLEEVSRQFTRQDGCLFISGTSCDLPERLKPHCACICPPPPVTADFHDLIKNIYRDLNERQKIQCDLDRHQMQNLLRNLNGLSLMEAEKILTKAMVEDGHLAPDDIRHVIAAKKEIVEREGLLEYFPREEDMADIAGIANLKQWLAKRRRILTEPQRAREFGLDFPRGILLLGVPGAGKSLCAKAVAMDWQLPLLKMDPSGLYNKYIGESEKNFSRAMQTAEKVAPVILWIDEIEKAFASAGSEDGGVSQRILGIFLSWLQDRKGDIFVVATANDVSKLPPELLRKGRFDEIFFVDLPDAAVRRKIFEIHLKKRGRNPADFDLDSLAAAAEDFSGSEIEQAIVAALYTAFAGNIAVSTELILNECRQTVPLSRTRAEDMANLRQWAVSRAVPAQ